MEFKKYQHVERFGTVETQGIDMGMCYVFPKIDGTNASVWLTDKGQMGCGSRNRTLALDNDNAGFMQWATKQKSIREFINRYPLLRLYGEWLVPHTLRTYQENAWRQFYVFDVYNNETELYIPYEEYQSLLSDYEIEYIPPICKVENPTYERLVAQLEKNGFLIEDGKGTGEGVVVKNYDYKNKFGRQTWAKIVKNEFKAKHQKCDVGEIKESKIVEQEIVNKYVTKSLVEKEHAKIEEWTSKMIPRLLNTVFYCLVKEESWNFIKDFKNPTIDFKRLMYFAYAKVKEHKPELF